MHVLRTRLFVFTFFITFLFFPISSYASTYYVDSTSGSDSNNGTSEGTPWKTINKVNTSSFLPGDSILFKKGEVWREQLTPPSSGTAGNVITFGSYGSGPNPIIKRTNINSVWWEHSLIKNGSFEVYTGTPNDSTSDTVRDWLVGVDGGNTVEAVSDPQSNSYSIKSTKFTTTVANSYIRLPNITVLPNTTYYFEYYGKKTAGPNDCRVYIRDSTNTQWLFENGTWATNTDDEGIYPASLRVTESTFTKKSKSFTTQSNTTQLWIQLTQKYNQVATCVWDSVYLIQGSSKPSISIWAGYDAEATYYRGAVLDGVRLPINTSTFNSSFSMADGYFNGVNASGYYLIRRDSGAPGAAEIGVRLNAINISSKSYITIDGIDTYGPGGRVGSSYSNGPTSNSVGVYINASDNITVKNSNHSYSDVFGLTATNTSSNVAFDNLEVHDNANSGLYNSAQTGSVTKSTVRENGKVLTDSGDNGGIASFQSSNIRIEGNHVYDNGHDASNQDMDVSVVAATGPVQVLRNHIHDCVQGCIQIAEGGNNSTIAYNIIEDYGTSVQSGESYGKDSGIRIGGGVGGVSGVGIYNNVFHSDSSTSGSQRSGIAVTLAASSGLKIKNNIFYNNTLPDISINSTVTTTDHDYSHNVYYRPSFANAWNWKGTNQSSVSAWQTASSQDSDAIISDPQFVDASTSNYRLKDTSSLINTGIDVGQPLDLYGTSVPQGSNTDIGVYEKYETVIAPTATPGPIKIQPNTEHSISDTPANCPKEYVYCSDIGPRAFKTATGFVGGSGNTSELQLYIPKTATPHDLHIVFTQVNIFDLFSNQKEIIPFPWMQGLNTAGEIYRISVLSAFNGYPIVDFASQGIVIIPFDHSILAKRGIKEKDLRIAVFNSRSRRWEVLNSNTVVNSKEHTLANITDKYGYFAVVYKK